MEILTVWDFYFLMLFIIWLFARSNKSKCAEQKREKPRIKVYTDGTINMTDLALIRYTDIKIRDFSDMFQIAYKQDPQLASLALRFYSETMWLK